MSRQEPPFSSDQPPSAEDSALDGLLADLLSQWQDEEAVLATPEEQDCPAQAPVEFHAAPVDQTLALLAALPAPDTLPLGDTAPEPESAPPEPKAHPSPVTPLPAKSEALLELVRTIYRNLEQARLAATDAPGQKHGKDGYVVVRLAGDNYAIPIRQVLETDRLPRFTPLPRAPDFVRGVANLRGQILPLLDLRLWLGNGHSELAEGRMVVVRGSDGAASGLIVDGLAGIAWIGKEELTPVAPDSSIKLARLLAGIGRHRQAPVGVLDLERLLASEELEELRSM